MLKTLVVAIGSTVMTDDAVAHHVLEQLQQQAIAADFVDLGMDIFRLRLFLKDCHTRIIIIDALAGEYPPGTILTFSYEDFQDTLNAKLRNVHHIGSIEALEIMRLADESLAQKEIFFVGIIAQTIDKGLTLTPKVKKAIPQAVDMVKRLVIQ
jgi:hydrogenase maturation protease